MLNNFEKLKLPMNLEDSQKLEKMEAIEKIDKIVSTEPKLEIVTKRRNTSFSQTRVFFKSEKIFE